MIDNPDKTDRLLAEIEASLPLETRLSPNVRGTLAKQSPESTIPGRCMVTDVFYMGDEGGIACRLDIGRPDTKTSYHRVHNSSHLRQAMPCIPPNRGLSAASRQKTQAAGRTRILTPAISLPHPIRSAYFASGPKAISDHKIPLSALFCTQPNSTPTSRLNSPPTGKCQINAFFA